MVKFLAQGNNPARGLLMGLEPTTRTPHYESDVQPPLSKARFLQPTIQVIGYVVCMHKLSLSTLLQIQ